jgi:hypothetical protein
MTVDSPVSRRHVLKFVLSTAGVALLAACGPAAGTPAAAPSPAAANPTTPPTPASAAQAAPATPTLASAPTRVQPQAAATPQPAVGQPKSGGTLRLGMSGDVSTLDGHNTTPNQYDTTWSVFDRLISYDTNLQPSPTWPKAGI